VTVPRTGRPDASAISAAPTTPTRPRAGRLQRTQRALGVLLWTLVAASTVIDALLRAPAHAAAFQQAVLIELGLFFPLLLVRLAVTFVARPRRRRASAALGVAMASWAVGSALLQTTGALTLATLFTPAMMAFTGSYIALFTFLVLDAERRRHRALRVWLETTVACAGTASVAALVFLTPLAHTFGSHGVGLLMALLFPLADVVLAVLVVGQIAAHQRTRGRRTARLLLALVGLCTADLTYLVNLGSTTYVGSAAVDVIYGVSFALIVGVACTPEHERPAPAVPRQRARTLVLAAAVAVLVLVLNPSGPAAWYVVPPAVITLAAAGGLLTLALRESQGAAEALRLSRTDELTGLGNRRAVLAAVDAGLDSPAPLALMLLDLDGFKEINDSLGHSAGDGVLEAVAVRLEDTLGTKAMVGRLGGDEFALVVAEDDRQSHVALAGRVRATLLQPVQVDNLDLAIRASIGITVRQPSDLTATDLLRRADVAMYEAKASRAGALFYDAARDSFSRERLRLAEELREGIERGELVVWYQPQIDALTKRVVAVEALVRWQHPQDGLLPPIAFLPDARRSGLMLALTDEVMRTVVADARDWAEDGLDLRVSMNCAPPELLGGALLPRLFDAIDRAGLAPNTLTIEVTEDSFLTDPAHARQILHELREHHVQAAIDDYGTGFSSLAYLRDLPVHELKMDRSFISTILTDERSRVIVDSTNQMAHAMGLRLVAEGVEDEEIAQTLATLGIDVLQGYHIGRPMPSPDVARWVRQWSDAQLGPVSALRPR
jgi:diguanylate cyclase (GGDEF)-like protein